MPQTVYLAGPIKGLKYEEAIGWREKAKVALEDQGILVRSPMRYKGYLKPEPVIKDAYEQPDHPLSTGHGITSRDRFDVSNCDVVLMNLVGAEHVSIGTMIEVGWADAFRKPIILVIDEANIHKHGMLMDIVSFIVPTLEEGLDTVIALLNYE